jgi:phage terminase large subunit-like protein
MVPASKGLHAAIVEGRLMHAGHPDLDRHVANAIAKSTPRGWRLDKTDPAVEIDGAVALAIAVDRAAARAAGRSRYLGMA